MRKILFRGYSRIDNQWHFGDLNCKYVKDGYAQIDEFSVDKDSIGQYTGFKYQNGQRIYEGDYVEDKDLNVTGFVRFCAGRWCVEDINEPLEEKELYAIYDLIDFKGTEYEILNLNDI